MTDEQVLAADFKLADAQLLVALAAGFETWTALREEIETVTETNPEDAACVLLAAEPQLFTTDIAAALDYYVLKLGFSVAFRYGEPPFYAQVFRDGARLNLRHVDALPVLPETQSTDLLAATIVLNEAKPLFLEYQGAGADITQALRTEPWGARTFVVRDPDGNLILFASAAAKG